MARPAKGTIWERRNAAGGVNRTLRFYAYGKRRTSPLGSVSREEAERQLAFTLADVARGTWEPAGSVRTEDRQRCQRSTTTPTNGGYSTRRSSRARPAPTIG